MRLLLLHSCKCYQVQPLLCIYAWCLPRNGAEVVGRVQRPVQVTHVFHNT